MNWIEPVIVFAQGDPSALSGGAGWVGAGLLGLVLCWLLLKHLPEKDSQIERLMIRHQSEMSAALAQERSEFTGALGQQRVEFTGALERILRHNELQTAALSTAINKDIELVRHQLRDAIDKPGQMGRADR